MNGSNSIYYIIIIPIVGFNIILFAEEAYYFPTSKSTLMRKICVYLEPILLRILYIYMTTVVRCTTQRLFCTTYRLLLCMHWFVCSITSWIMYYCSIVVQLSDSGVWQPLDSMADYDILVLLQQSDVYQNCWLVTCDWDTSGCSSHFSDSDNLTRDLTLWLGRVIVVSLSSHTRAKDHQSAVTHLRQLEVSIKHFC